MNYILKIKEHIHLVLFGALVLLPFLFSSISDTSYSPFKIFYFSLLCVVSFVILLIKKINEKHFFIPSKIFLFSFGGVILSFILSTAFSNNVFISLIGRQISMYSLFGILSCIGLVYVLYYIFNYEKKRDLMFLFIFFSSILLVSVHFLFIIFKFLPPFGSILNFELNTLGGWYDLGVFSLFTALSSAIFLQFFYQSKLYRVLSIFGLIISLFLILIINIKILFVIGLIFSLMYVIIFVFKDSTQGFNQKIPYGVITILIVLSLSLLVGTQINSIFQSTLKFNPIQEVSPSFSATLSVAKNIFIQEKFTHKIFGVGLDRFDVAWLKYKPTDVNITKYWDIDFRNGFSFITTAFINQGLFGVLMWVIFYLFSIYFSIKLLQITFKKKTDVFITLYIIFGYMYFLIMFVLYNPSVSIISFFIIFLALFISLLFKKEIIICQKKLIEKKPKIYFVYIGTIIFLLIGYLYIVYIQISQYSSKVIFDRALYAYNHGADITNTIIQIEKAFFIFDSDIYARSLTNAGLVLISEIIEDPSLTQEQITEQFSNVLRNTIQYAQTAILIDTHSYVNKLNLVHVYKNLIPLNVQNAKEEAVKLIDDMYIMTPNNPTLYLEKARVYTLAKEYDYAIEEIKKALEIKPNFVDAIFLLSQIQVEKGDIKQAIESINTGIYIDATNSTLYFQLGLLYYNQKQFSNAISAFENAIHFSPDFANARYFLGLSYYYDERISDAILIFENLYKIFPDNQELKIILDNMKTGHEPLNTLEKSFNQKLENQEELPLKENE